MKEAANSLLKVLEEPPAYATIVLLAENPGELLPLSAPGLASSASAPSRRNQIEKLLAERRHDLSLLSALSSPASPKGRSAAPWDSISPPGSPPAPTPSSFCAMLWAKRRLRPLPCHRNLPRRSRRPGKTEALLRAASSILEDLLLLKSETPQLVRNIDLQRELAAMATGVTFDWIESAARGLRQVESGMRRNLLRSLTLDSFAAQLSSS